MKRLGLVLVGAFTFLLVSCGGGPSVEGTWQLHSVSGEELTEHEKDMTLTFKEDGSCESSRGDESATGTWELSDDGKTLTFELDGREEKCENVEVTDDELTFEQGSDKITLKRK